MRSRARTTQFASSSGNVPNASLATNPFRGLVVVCPYLPDVDLHKPAPIKDYGKYLLEMVLPRVRSELPVTGKG